MPPTMTGTRMETRVVTGMAVVDEVVVVDELAGLEPADVVDIDPAVVFCASTASRSAKTKATGRMSAITALVQRDAERMQLT